MNLKLKNSLILTGTLILGIVIGILVSGRAINYKMNNARSFYTERGFNRQIIKMINPTKEQKRQLHPILKEQAKKNRKLFIKCKKERDDLMKEFREKIKPYLTDEQMERFDKMQFHRTKMRQMNHARMNGKKGGRE